MKVVTSLSILLLSSRVFGFCLPNTLEFNKTDKDDINNLENLAEEIRSVFLPRLGSDEDLVIVFESLSPKVNAEIKKNNNQLVLELHGGMLSHSKMNEDTFRLLLCHELGHVLGGRPLKSRTGWSSTEGQADYYSGKECAQLLGMDETALLKGALSLTEIYAEVMRESPPRLESYEEVKVERTNYGYPSVQCRLQTILAGWREEPRPTCWFWNNTVPAT
ncbi:MAG TPA: hypothetical protein VNJ01_09850 [Bacteriovoracaceae bacterium]|nr:hypothetical protein [Bacteriovoracaceae bacterium]